MRWLNCSRFMLTAAAVLILAACAPAAAPTPTAVPKPAAPAPVAQPTAAPKPAAPTAAAPKPAAAAPTAAPAKPAAAAPKKTVKLKYGTSSAVGFAEVPAIAAFEALKAEGIEVELVPFQSTDIGTKALVGGQIDLGITNPQGILAANRAGADLRIFFNGKRNEWILMVPSSIKEPKQLDGKRIAHHGTGITKALALYVGDKYGIKPNYLTVPGSEARVQALIQGQIDASPVDIAGMIALENLKPGAFHPLIKFEEELPGVLNSNHFTAKRERLEGDPTSWQALTTALVKHFRRAIQDPEWLADQAVKVLPKVDRKEMFATASAYSQGKVFSVDGGLNKDKSQKMLDFYVERDLIKKDDILPFDQWATTKFVDAANATLGR